MVINGEPAHIGLALSGGGFRAALYHLGVLRKLLEWDLLWEIDLISSLSGGSITGAFIAQHWGDEKALDELEYYLTSQSLTANYYEGILNPFKTRTEIMAECLSKNLFGNATLSSLADGPRSYISASNLSTGNLFSFIAGGNMPAKIGESYLGFQEDNANQFRVADAVAASCAFAPIYPPYRLNQEHYKCEMDFITLSDGGLYDNLAVDPLLVAENKIQYAIVSDAGKPFNIDTTPTQSGMAAVWRTINVLTEKVRTLQLERLVLLDKNESGPKPIYLSIDNYENCKDVADVDFCCAVPSELSKLNSTTSALLQGHAQNQMAYRFNQAAPELLASKNVDVKDW